MGALKPPPYPDAARRRQPCRTHQSGSDAACGAHKRAAQAGPCLQLASGAVCWTASSLRQLSRAARRADKYRLRRFLRARQHDLKRARAMWADDVKWRKEFGADSILENFHFHERDAFISVYPQGYHKTDKMVRPAGRVACGLPMAALAALDVHGLLTA